MTSSRSTEQGPLHHLYYDRIVELVRAFGESQDAPVERAGEAVATAWGAGGRLLLARTNHCLHHEGIGRASGPLGIDVLEDESDFHECHRLLNASSKDVVLIHVNTGTYGRSVGIALRAREIGALTIGLTQLPFELNPAVPVGHPSGQRLHEVVDVLIDLGGDVGDGAVVLPDSSRRRVAPTSGVTGLLAFWMIIAAACDNVVRAGRTPLVLESSFLPGAIEQNESAQQQWHRTGLPFEGPRSETDAAPIAPRE